MALDGGQQDNGGLFYPDGTQYMTQQLVTIPTAETPAAAPAVATPAPESPAPAPASGTAPVARDKDLDLARKFETVAQHEGRARKAEREAQAKLAGLSDREKRLAEREAELEDALSDPVGYMLKTGKDPVEVAKRYAKPESEEEKRIRKLEERAAQQEEDANRRKTEWEKQQYEQAKFGAMKSFVGAITSKECPNLTLLYQAHEVPRLVEELLARPTDPDDDASPTMVQAFREAHGRAPTDKEIREGLEYEAELRATSILEAHRREQARRASVATSPGSTEQSSPKSESGPNGISNKHAAGASSPSKKPLSLEEKRKKARKDLTAALEAEAGDD